MFIFHTFTYSFSPSTPQLHWEPFEGTVPPVPSPRTPGHSSEGLLGGFGGWEDAPGLGGSQGCGWPSVYQGRVAQVVGRVQGGEGGDHRRVRWDDPPYQSPHLVRPLPLSSRVQGWFKPSARDPFLGHFQPSP